MQNPTSMDKAVRAVIEDYEVRAQREEQQWNTLPEEQIRRRLDEFLLPIGRAAGTLVNLIIKEGEARRILEVGSSYGYSTMWLAEWDLIFMASLLPPSSRSTLDMSIRR